MVRRPPLWAQGCCRLLRRQGWAWLAVAWLLGAAWFVPSARAWDRERMVAAAQRLGARAAAEARELQALITQAQAASEPQRLRLINRHFNTHITYAEDIDTAGQTDRWDSPLELLARGAGDCEDYAIAKYFTLLAAGVPGARMRLVYVRAQRAGSVMPHMVLAWYAQPDAEPQILDNLEPEVRPASARPDLQPVFSFNAEGLWQGTAGARAGDPSSRLSRWREVLARARAEGFL